MADNDERLEKVEQRLGRVESVTMATNSANPRVRGRIGGLPLAYPARRSYSVANPEPPLPPHDRCGDKH